MTEIIHETLESNKEDDLSQKVRQHFLFDENFTLLKKYQSEIFRSLEIAPSVKKLVNLLVTEENLEKVKTQFIAKHSI